MLKQLKLEKTLSLKREELETLEQKILQVHKRSEDIRQALEESESLEDVETVEQEINSIENETSELEAEKLTIEQEIQSLEDELSELKEKAEQINIQVIEKTENRNRGVNIMNRLQVQDMVRSGEYYNRSDVQEFYENFRNLNLRAVTGAELTIPLVVVNRIMNIVGDYSTLYNLVDRIQISGTARIVLDVDTTPATWMEQKTALPVGDIGTIGILDLDGYKIGKVVFCDNHLVKDSIVNLDEYVSNKLARAIGLGLDIAILSGTGAVGFQPTGILPNIPAGNKTTIVGATAKTEDFFKPIGLVDTGLDYVGEITAVMKRSTYYNWFFKMTLNVNKDGILVGNLPNVNRPDILGIPVVFNNNMPAGQVLFGDFKKYVLVERESITVDSSEHIRYVEDQLAFRGKARYDGKSTSSTAFSLLTIT